MRGVLQVSFARKANESNWSGGEGGIRTHETVARLHAFQACAFDHSATSPKPGRRTIAKHPSGSSEGEATLAVHHAMLIARRFEYEPPMAYVCVIAPSGTLSSHADVVAHYGRLAAPACHGRRRHRRHEESGGGRRLGGDADGAAMAGLE